MAEIAVYFLVPLLVCAKNEAQKNIKGSVKVVTPILKFVKQHTVVSVVFVTLALLASSTRFYKLGEVPHGITWDEAAIGYNGYSVITTRRDEWLQKLPVSFQSYGDYKAPLAIYTVGISTVVLGITPFAVRAPFALAGLLFIVSFGFLVKELFHFSKMNRVTVIVALVFAITSPWHFHYSRIGFESGMALGLITFALANLVFVKNQFEKEVFNKTSVLLLLSAALSLVASLYTYHSAKITVPLLLIFFGILLKKLILSKKLVFSLISLISIAALYPLLNDSLTGSGAERANVLLTSQGLPFFDLVRAIIINFVKHFSLDFLLFGKTDSLRHGTGSWGVLTPMTLLLAALGSLLLLRKKMEGKFYYSQIGALALFLIFAGIVPAALSAETVPHSNRSLLALPGFLLLAVMGLHQIVLMLEKYGSQIRVRLSVGVVLLVELLFFVNLWNYYFYDFAKNSSPDFQDGYVEAFTIAKDYEKGTEGKPEVSSILFSSEYGQPYMYALFVRKTSPIYYRGGSLNKYVFTDKIYNSDLERDNTLIVATPSMNMPIDQVTHIVKGSDNQPRFLIFYTGN